MSSLPFLLAGPIVRRADADGVWFWFACREEIVSCTPRITVYDSHGHVNDTLAPDGGFMRMGPSELRVARLGEHLWVALVKAKPLRELTREWIYGYDLAIQSAHESTQLGGLDLAYAPFALPTFMLRGGGARLAQASCRRPGGDGADAYGPFDAWLKRPERSGGITSAPIADTDRRPAALILTGDQIYADDVAPSLFAAVQRLAGDAFGYVERIPNWRGAGTVAADRAVDRKRLTAEPSSPIGFTTDDGDRHLLTFPEFAAMYLLVLNKQLCTDYGVDDHSVALRGFADAVGACRRVLANTPTYMLCDDHEITDDWNLDEAWVRGTSNPTARRVIANGLAAYWAFQAWGNDPDRFEALRRPVTGHLEALRAARGEPGAAGPAFDHDLHAQHWSFVTATSPPALCVDTRTAREFPSGKTAVLSGPRVWPDLTALAERHRLGRGGQLLLVLPTPLLDHRLLTRAQAHYDYPEKRYYADYELYVDNPVQRGDLIRYLRRQFAPESVVIFSGDVHIGYVADGLYAGGTRADLEAGRATWTLPVVQVTASPIKNIKDTARSWGGVGEDIVALMERRFDAGDGSTVGGVRRDPLGMTAFPVHLPGQLSESTFIWRNEISVVDLRPDRVDTLFVGGTAGAISTATASVRIAADVRRLAAPTPPPIMRAHSMSPYMQTAIEDALQDAGNGSPAPNPCAASPHLTQVLDACAARLATLAHDVNASGSVARTGRERVRRECGFDVAPGEHPPAVYDPYVNVNRSVLEAVIRAAHASHQPPEILMAIWQREGSLRMPLAPWPVPQATTQAHARTIARSDLFWQVLGTDRFTAARPNPQGGENIYDNGDASAPDHDRHFHAAIAELVRGGQLASDPSAAIDAELTVAPRTGGGFQVTPTLCFYVLSLRLIDAFFTKLWQNRFPEAAAYGPMLNYQQFNQGSFAAFLRSAEHHRTEAAYRRADGSSPTLEEWAYHTTIRANEYAQPRRNAIRFGHFVDCFAPIFAPSMAEIRPASAPARAHEAIALADPIEGYVYDATGTACATGARPGASALLLELQGRFHGHSDGIFNCRPVRGGTRLSLHGEGRAVDWALSAADAADAAEAQRIIDWLLGNDGDGNPDALARRMGVQEIIWNHRIWSSRRHAEGFRAYTGVNPHTDHLHIGLSHEGAEMHTSHWRAQASAPPAAQGLTLPSTSLHWDNATPEQLEFMHRVYDAHVARSARSRAYVDDVPAAELGPIEGGVRARTETATGCRDLLAAARAALAAAKEAHDARAASVERISIVSGYRSASQQLHGWQAAFPTYYRETVVQRQAAPGGEHGEQAAELTVRYISARLGAPGFSLHNNGLAVDLGTREAGHDLGATTNRDNVARWRASWLFEWLGAHAQTFGFRQNTHIDEPWHWEFHGRPAGAPAGQQGLTVGFSAIAARDRLVVDDLPLLHDHHDVNPDLVLRWNAMAGVPDKIDVVLHLHGFSGDRHLNLLASKLPLSGLDFGPPPTPPSGARALPPFTGRTRPTLCVLPRGKCADQPNKQGIWPYRFPAITRPAGFQNLLSEAISRFCSEIGATATIPIGRLIITAHSGGGAPLNQILAFTESLRLDPHEVHVFDAFYGPTDNIERWLARRLGADVQRLAAGVPDPPAYLRTDGGALRVLYIDGAGTQDGSRRVDQAAARLVPAGTPYSTAVRDRYAAQRTTVDHTHIPYWYGGRLLADAGQAIASR